MPMTKRFLKLGLCLTVFISLFALSVQAAETVKLGRYVTDAGEFTWELTLNTDNTFELVRTDYEGLYNDNGVWIADDNGNVLVNISGLVTVLSQSDGGNILTLDGTLLYYDPTTAGVSTVTTVSDIYGDLPPKEPTLVPDADLLITTSLLPATATVSPAASTVYVDGEAKSLEAYNIAGSNYFKLRDIAFVLNGTEKQFDIGYDDSSKDVTLIPATPYTVVGGEMAQGDGNAKTATASASTVLFHGDPLNIPSYNIADSNFFKLVDLMRALDVGIVYNADEKSVYLSTDAPHMGVLTISDITIFPNEEFDDPRPQS